LPIKSITLSLLDICFYGGIKESGVTIKASLIQSPVFVELTVLVDSMLLLSGFSKTHL
jgi:hypothetical protein